MDQIFSKTMEVKTVDELTQDPGKDADYTDWSIGFLLDYIEGRHHGYVRDSLGPLKEYIDNLVKEYGVSYPRLSRLSDLFSRLSEKLSANMTKEEQVLFPFIKNLIAGTDSGKQLKLLPFLTLERPFQLMRVEHEQVIGLMNGVWSGIEAQHSELGSSGTWKVCYDSLKDFRKNLEVHFHLENNVLFPKAREMERVQHRLEAIS